MCPCSSSSGAAETARGNCVQNHQNRRENQHSDDHSDKGSTFNPARQSRRELVVPLNESLADRIWKKGRIAKGAQNLDFWSQVRSIGRSSDEAAALRSWRIASVVRHGSNFPA